MTATESRLKWQVIVHATVLLLICLAFVGVLYFGTNDDASIGAGWLIMALLILGAPWSLTTFVIRSFQELDPAPLGFWLVSFSIVNFAIHVIWVRNRQRRMRRN